MSSEVPIPGPRLSLEALDEPAALVDGERRVVGGNGAWLQSCGQVDGLRGAGQLVAAVLRDLRVSGGDRAVLELGLGDVLGGRAERFDHVLLCDRDVMPRSIRIHAKRVDSEHCLVRRTELERGSRPLEQWRASWAGSLAGIGCWEVDIPKDELWWSDEVYRIHEINHRRPITVKEAITFYAPGGREVIEAAVDKGIADGSPWEVYLPLITAKGREIWVLVLGKVELVDGQPRRLYGVLRDVTEERNAEIRLRESEERLNLVVQGSSDGYWDWILGTDTIYYSPRYLGILGYEMGEVEMSMEFFADALHPDDADATWAAFNAHLESQRPFDVEFRMQHKDGRYRWIWSRGEALRDELGVPIRMAGVHSDITSLHEAREALEQARSAAEEASRSKSAFLANMSHEIRTPMTAILGFTELLKDQALDPRVRADHVQTIRRNGEHLLTILNDILDISKVEAGRLEVERIAMSPRAAIEDAYELMQARAEERGIDLQLEFAGGLPREFASDPVRIRQILNNLVGNAIKFTREGRVTLRAEYSPTRRVLTFEIADTGIGMDAGQLQRLFQPFTQADSTTTREFGGTGLGLAISKRLAEALGGQLEATSSPGVGSLFRLELSIPADHAIELVDQEPRKSVDSPSAALPTPVEDSLAGYRILLAEDGADNRRLISHHLLRAGAEVETVENGRLAVEAVTGRDQGALGFDVILMDMQMPELDGYGAMRELRAAGIRIPIIALTAHAMSGDRERCFDAGCDEFLTKPINSSQLINLCRTASMRAAE
ncbi:PAS domain-containing hybrid sensor histidine kinase/response regulator [Engelhardtia mirabilis]|uniref:histidine kinase n=1 Tax=Engelhardtia mirabilis TaxID=2528011 RepID=A0A518BFG0_9BACT|nr:Autoinducer 2 sensor kinase/phosphatase LuxQ [Planctomycetes bacterium Pla133]QDV00044.1 Autoinducer 2 sensor kinase/phosphatase LuxQ [Planctomycetes bacterium Pla86]